MKIILVILGFIVLGFVLWQMQQPPGPVGGKKDDGDDDPGIC